MANNPFANAENPFWLPKLTTGQGIQKITSLPVTLPMQSPLLMDQQYSAAEKNMQDIQLDSTWLNNIIAAAAARQAQEASTTGEISSSAGQKNAENKTNTAKQTNVPANINTALKEALKITNTPESWLPYLQWLVTHESGGNPRAVNKTPVKTKYGAEHATGLFQTLPSTFKAHALPGHTNIFDPVDNAIAAIRYIKGRYGSPDKIPGIMQTPWKGY